MIFFAKNICLVRLAAVVVALAQLCLALSPSASTPASPLVASPGIFPAGYDVAPSVTHLTVRNSNGSHTIYFPKVILEAPHTPLQWAKKFTKHLPHHSSNGSEPWMEFIPLLKATLPSSSLPMYWAAPCFQDMTATLTLTADGADVLLKASNRSSLLCKDEYLLATSSGFYLKTIILGGDSHASFDKLDPQERADIARNGLAVFLVNDGVISSLKDVWYTLKLFEPRLDKNMVEDNVLFLREYMGLAMAERANVTLSINESDIRSGDMFFVLALSGFDPMIMLGTGGHVGHVAMAVRFGGELYAVESTSAQGFAPFQHGIVKTPLKQWLPGHLSEQSLVTLARLRSDLSAKFDEEKAGAFFASAGGLPYGFHNFVMGWVDTAEGNYPLNATSQLLSVLVAILDKIRPADADLIFNDAWNMRLGTHGLRTNEIFDTLIARNMSFTDLMVIPEQDDWVYSDGPSMVCDVFVLEMLRAAGIFGNWSDSFQATEFTPKDLYQLNIFDTDPTHMPAPCQAQNSTQPYCQLMGCYVQDLPGFSTIDLYAHMNEKCPSLWPAYVRPDGC